MPPEERRKRAERDPAGPARGKTRGGFSFQLSEDTRKARVQVKHISGRASLIQFAALRKRRDTKGDRKKQDRVPVRRGSFVDVKTIAALMGLWRFVIAKGMAWRDATSETAKFLDRATLADLQKPETWSLLTTLVRIKPDDDVLPVRARYAGEPQATKVRC